MQIKTCRSWRYQVNNAKGVVNFCDKGNFEGKLTSAQKKLIKKLGPHQPKGLFPREKEGRNKNRRFDEKWYFQKGKDSLLTIKCNWLLYSTNILNDNHCQPCWLFNMSLGDLGFSKGTVPDT